MDPFGAATVRERVRSPEEGTTDRIHNVPGTRRLQPQPALRRFVEASLRQTPFEMDAERRNIVLEAIRDVSRHKCWRLLAAQVRCNHVHIVVEAEVSPELAMNAFKAYASRALNFAYPGE